jgi:hypothetical protein
MTSTLFGSSFTLGTAPAFVATINALSLVPIAQGNLVDLFLNGAHMGTFVVGVGSELTVADSTAEYLQPIAVAVI